MSILNGFEMVNEKKERPFFTLRNTTITFSKLAYELLNCSEYVHYYIDKKNSRFAIQASGKDEAAVSFYSSPEPGKQVVVRWGNKQRAELLMGLAGIEDCGKGIRIFGDYYEDEKVLIFDMKVSSEN